MPDLYLRRPSAPESAPRPRRAPPADPSAPSASRPVSPRSVDPSSDPLVTTTGAALVLGVSRDTLTAWRATGLGPPYVRPTPSGKHVRYRLSDLHAWLALRIVQPGRTLPRWYHAAGHTDRPPRLATTPLGLDRTEGAAAVLNALDAAAREAGGLRRWCDAHGIGRQTAVAVLEGRTVMPPRIAAVLGYRCLRIVRYVKVDPKP